MRQRKLAGIAAGALVLPLALAACGSSKESSGGSSGSSSSATKTVTIGVIAPLSGDLAAVGGGIRDGVDLAVKQANAAKAIPGYTIKIDAEDDEAKPDTGARAAAKLASESDVVGVVGPLNSSVGLTVAPSLSGAGVAEISPANSNPSLTGRDKTPQTRPYKTYFRVVATDDLQGPFGAEYVVKTLNKKTIAVVNDKLAYGVGLSKEFAKEASTLGAKVLPTQSINDGDKDFSAVISKIKPSKPDALFYGGQYPEAALLTKQLKQAGLNIPLIGGDGVNSSEFITEGGSATNGDYATSLGAPTDSLASAKKFVADYTAQHYKEDKDPYGAYSYDAANTFIKAAAKALAGKSSVDSTVRAAVVTNVQNADFQGVTGLIKFDAFGDTVSKILTVYEVQGGAFVPKKTENFTK